MFDKTKPGDNLPKAPKIDIDHRLRADSTPEQAPKAMESNTNKSSEYPTALDLSFRNPKDMVQILSLNNLETGYKPEPKSVAAFQKQMAASLDRLNSSV